MAIKIAADSNIIISLSKFMDPRFDPDGEVYLLLKTHSYLPSAVFRDFDKKDLPPILKDGWLGQLTLQQDGLLYYQNLYDIYKLAMAVKHKSIELCITPLAYLETNRKRTADFIKEYCTVLTVKDSDAPEFYTLRNELATKYTQSGAMEEILDGRRMKMQPSNDAYIMAEASLFGLDLITANEKDFIHEVVADADYKRQNGIYKVNLEEDIVFSSNIDDTNFIPSSKNLANFLSKLRRYMKGRESHGMIYTDNPNIDENNQFYKP